MAWTSHSNNRSTTVRTQIGPRLSPETKALLDTACQEGRGSVSDIVDEALRQYLAPDDTADPRTLFHKLREMEATLSSMMDLLQAIVEHLKHTAADEPPARTATYAEMYGMVEHAASEPPPAEPLSTDRTRHGWQRWFVREGAP